MAKQWTPRRVRSEEERQSGGSSDYLSLDEGESFTGIALFEGDPAKDEPGCYEYLEHWIETGKGKSVPCPGDGCPFCEDGDRPRSRAKSLWFVLKDQKGTEVNELRIFNLGVRLLKQFSEYRAEGEKIKGRHFRVSRPEKNSYTLMPKATVAKVAEVKEYLKDAPELEQLVTKQLQKAMEGIAIQRVLDDDDDESQAAAPSNGGKGKGKSKAKQTEDWPQEAEDVTAMVTAVDEDGNFVTVESDEYDGTKDVYTTDGIEFDLATLNEGDEFTFSAEQDGDGDYILTAEPEGDSEGDAASSDEPSDEENDLPESIEGEVFTVTGSEPDESTLDVESDELSFTLYFLDTMEVDFDDYPEGTKVKVSAEKDRAGDLVATEVPEVVTEKKTRGGRKTAGGTTRGKGKS